MSNLRPPPAPPSRDTFAVLHQSPEDPRTSLPSLLVLLVLGLVAAHRALAHYDIPLRVVPETLWNCFVYVMPASLVFALGQPSFSVTTDASTGDGKEERQARVFAAKNEVLRRVFGLDGAVSGDGTLRRAGRLLNGSKDAVPPGLGNWDNSCYQNSVIQGLASLHSLHSFLAKGIDVFGNLGIDSTNAALLDTVRKLNDPENHGHQLWTPAKLKSMSSWQQQDAQEYFSKVLDEIDKEILRASRQAQRIPGLEHVPSVEDENPSSPARKAESIAYPESLRNPLEGLLAQRVGCMNCGYTEGLSMIPFNCLTVPLQVEWGYGCDIRDCLNEYTKLEPIEGVECARCTLLKTEEHLDRLLDDLGESQQREALAARLSIVRQALEDEDFADSTLIKKCQIPRKYWVSSTKSRQAVVGRAPKSLVIHVNRSVFDEVTGAQRKNYATVIFPEALDLGPWSIGSGEPEGANYYATPESWSTNPAESLINSHVSFPSPILPYELRAVVTHYGRHENGHYVCYRKHPYTAAEAEIDKNEEKTLDPDDGSEETERWWRLSDEDVSKVSKEDVLAQGGVFMLFYEAREVPHPPSPLSSPLLRRSSTATIRAVAPMSSMTEMYAPVAEQDDEGSVGGDSVVGEPADSVPAPSEPIPAEIDNDNNESETEVSHINGILDISAASKSAPALFHHRTTDSTDPTPPTPRHHSDDGSSDYNSDLEDTVVLRKRARQRNSTISNASSGYNYPPTPLSPLSLSPTTSEQPPPFAEQPPTMSTDDHGNSLASPLFSPTHALATPIAAQSPNLDPVTRALIQESIEEEETEPRWTTSRSEYAPSTVATESEYAHSTVATSEGGDISDFEGFGEAGSEADEGEDVEKDEKEREKEPTEVKKDGGKGQRQSLTMRTAQAQGGPGGGDEKMGLEGQGLRMVAAT